MAGAARRATTGLTLLISLACTGLATPDPTAQAPDPHDACVTSAEQAMQDLLSILPEQAPDRYVRPRFTCDPEGLTGRVEVDVLHDQDPKAFAKALLEPITEELSAAAWADLRIELLHLPRDLIATTAFLEAQSDPVRNLRAMGLATTTFTLDEMGPRSTTDVVPRASRLEVEIAEILASGLPPGVQFDVQVRADIPRPLHNLFPEDKLVAEAVVRVAVEGHADDREEAVLGWIRGTEHELRALRSVTFHVSFFSDQLAHRPPRTHPELRRTGWLPLRLPAPAEGLSAPATTRRHDPGPQRL